jgi:predicted ATP-dependent protease
MGEVQPIGGVTRKIEGFFKCCKIKGLTGEQGVIIPKTNVRHLMLKQEVVDAVEQGQFHIWSVSSIDEGIEILTGIPAGKRDAKGNFPPESINGRVQARFKQIAQALREEHMETEHRDELAEGDEVKPPLTEKDRSPKERKKRK